MSLHSNQSTNLRSSTGEEVPGPAAKAPTRVLLKDLEIPPALSAAIRAQCEHFRFRSKRDRLYIEEELKLQYYYGGQDVACIQTPDGRAVVAAGYVGSGELREALQHLTPADRRSVCIVSPEPWDDQTINARSSRVPD